MKCESCDKILSDREDSRKSAASGERIGLCDDCYAPIAREVPSTYNPFLQHHRFETVTSPIIGDDEDAAEYQTGSQ
jgi:hypothetical protein